MLQKPLHITILILIIILVVMLSFSFMLDCGKQAEQLHVSSNNSLFDTPHKPVEASLPQDVRTFLTSLSERFMAHDLDGVMEYFSTDFFHQGKTRQMYREHIGKSFFLKHLTSMNIHLVKFSGHSDMADIAGFIETDLGYLLQSSEVLPLLEGSQLRREKGQWKFYGNQRKTPFGMFKDFISVTATLVPSDLTLYRRLLPEQFSMPETPTVSVNMTEHQQLALPFTPYRLGRISLLANYKGVDGWFDLTLPETSWPPVNFGQTVGYPKYIVDSIQLSRTRTGWQGQVKDNDQLILSIEFTPDTSVESWFERVTRPSCLGMVRLLLPAYRQKPFYMIKSIKPGKTMESRTLITRATISSYITPSIAQQFGKMRIAVDPAAPWAGLFPADVEVKGNLMKFSGDINLRHRILNEELQAP